MRTPDWQDPHLPYGEGCEPKPSPRHVCTLDTMPVYDRHVKQWQAEKIRRVISDSVMDHLRQSANRWADIRARTVDADQLAAQDEAFAAMFAEDTTIHASEAA